MFTGKTAINFLKLLKVIFNILYYNMEKDSACVQPLRELFLNR